jgi:hypothetical protein
VSLLLPQVFGPDSQQARVYQTAISPIVTEVLEGFNCTIFAYGQTGTGKTYTMEGGPRNSVDGSNMSAEAGIIPRAIKQIFDAIESDDVTDSSVKVRTHAAGIVRTPSSRAAASLWNCMAEQAAHMQHAFLVQQHPQCQALV